MASLPGARQVVSAARVVTSTARIVVGTSSVSSCSASAEIKHTVSAGRAKPDGQQAHVGHLSRSRTRYNVEGATPGVRAWPCTSTARISGMAAMSMLTLPSAGVGPAAGAVVHHDRQGRCCPVLAGQPLGDDDRARRRVRLRPGLSDRLRASAVSSPQAIDLTVAPSRHARVPDGCLRGGAWA